MNIESVEQELKKLIEICNVNLKTSNMCLEYLFDERKLSKEMIRKYQLGYFPQNINRLIENVSETFLQKNSIIDYSGSSPFTEYFYLIFPIFSEFNTPVGIGGRTLLTSEQREVFKLPKYKNSSFKKADHLYGFNFSKDFILYQQNAYIVEGYFDQIALDSNSVQNSVAICGTAFSRNHLLMLSKYTNKITFLLDQDDAGQIAMNRIYSKYHNLASQHGMKLEYTRLTKDCKDVDEYFLKGGKSEDFNSDLEYFVPNCW